MARRLPRTAGYVVAWVVAATVAVAVGLVAVTGVGASVRDRGPLAGEAQAVREAQLDDEGRVVADPDADRTSETFAGDFGSFVVTCQGAVALGDAATAAPGWEVVSYEQGPDDDVDAVFAASGRSVELEVYCNAGRPTVSEREDNTLPGSD
jgi:hypothetical protein